MWRGKHGLRVDLAIQGRPELPDDVKILVFEAVRELLFNTVKHGQVSVARVSLQQVSGSEMHICVIDQGTGFDPAQPEERQEPAAGLGLFSIREHIALIGGRLRITSSPGAGSCFDLQNPLQPVPVVCDCLPDLDVRPVGENKQKCQKICAIKLNAKRLRTNEIAMILPDLSAIADVDDHIAIYEP